VTDFQKAIQSAHVAQQSYAANTTATAKGSLLRKWYDLIIANQEDGEFTMASKR
jgi:succinate-semialdehyde dehydrogenase / glutarate-semialdehyde dehydrogenase